MSELVDRLAELTAHRDRDVLDVALVTALHDLLRPHQVAVHRAVGDAGGERWLTRARMSQADVTAVTASTVVIDSTTDAADIGSVIEDIDTAIDTVNNERATFGATQSRFEAIISNLQQGVENQSAARSRIMDADFAQETANLSRAQILQQAGTAMVAQANQLPQQVLSLLR